MAQPCGTEAGALSCSLLPTSITLAANVKFIGQYARARGWNSRVPQI